ncbi:MAG: WD40/YVTN/BNR-like repeat-containing protein [Candidatus Dormibacteria bacterium]
MLVALGMLGPVDALAAPPSAIGQVFVTWIAVSPAYSSTGTVVALGSTPGCSSNCEHLWVTHDGGASWTAARSTSLGPRIVIGVQAGREVLFTQTSGLMRSDDYGNTWRRVGDPGNPSISPTFASDGAVAVAGSSDYLLKGTTAQPVNGSGGADADQSFAFSPSFPSAGPHPAALLVAEDSHQLPVIQTCSAALQCSGGATLPGAGTAFTSFPVTLYPSSGFATDGTVFAQSGRGLYKSTDGGHTFVPLTVVADGASAQATPMMALAPGYAESGPIRTLYAAIFEVFNAQGSTQQAPRSGGGVFRSSDGGATWSKVSAGSPLDGGASAVAETPDGRLFAGYLPGTTRTVGLLCSTDGSTWAATCPAFRPSGTGPGGSGSTGGQTGAATRTTPPSSPNSGASSSALGAAGATATGAGGASGATPGGPSAAVVAPIAVLVAAVISGLVVVAARRRHLTPRRRNSA